MGDFLRHTWDLIVKGAMLAAGFLRGLTAGDNKAIVLLLGLMVADYISGLVAAFLKKSRKSVTGGLSSQAGAAGLLKKGLMLLVVLLAYVLDGFIGHGNAMFQTAVTWFYISNEALSLLENLAVSGVPIPKRLKEALERLSQESQLEAAPTEHQVTQREQPVRTEMAGPAPMTEQGEALGQARPTKPGQTTDPGKLPTGQKPRITVRSTDHWQNPHGGE